MEILCNDLILFIYKSVHISRLCIYLPSLEAQMVSTKELLSYWEISPFMQCIDLEENYYISVKCHTEVFPFPFFSLFLCHNNT